MGAERFLPNFAKAKVTLGQFLSLTDSELIGLGIEYPFERGIIQLGLMKFHKKKWSNKSLFVPTNFEEKINSFEFIMMLANLSRQLVVIKSSIVFMTQFEYDYDLTRAYDYFSPKYFNEFQSNLQKLQNEINAITETPVNPLLIKDKKKITKKRHGPSENFLQQLREEHDDIIEFYPIERFEIREEFLEESNTEESPKFNKARGIQIAILCALPMLTVFCVFQFVKNN